MADGHQRTAAEREQARRERANRRARRAGRPAPYGDPEVRDSPAGADAAAAPPPPVDEPERTPREPEPPVEQESPAEPEPPVVDEPPAPLWHTEAESITESPPLIQPREPAGHDPTPAERQPAEPEPETAPEPAGVPEPEPEPAPEPAGFSEPEPEPAGDPEPEPPARQPDSGRPLKSFPSPPDPEFYVPDDQLEMPSGTKRVARGARPGGRSPGPPGRPRRAPRRRPSPGPRRRGFGRWLIRLAALVALLLAAAIAWFAIELFQPFGTSPHGRVVVRIPPHTSSKEVGRILQRDGVISSRFFFVVRATLDGDRSDIRAGTYRLRHGMGYEAALAALTKVPKAAKTSEITIAEGHTRQYVAALLRRQHVKGSYLAASRHSPLLDPRHYGAPRSTDTLEGFLFPDTFRLVDPITATALVKQQLLDFKRRFATVSLGDARRHHIGQFGVITIASLIESESGSARDDRLVSSVIYNRLRDHMMLQLDSTTRYATGNLTGPLTERQLQSRSPYNTHTHFGLPPGPIDSPGLTALRAAADPANTSYLYFFTKPCSQNAVFASSYAQFEILLVRDHRNHCPK